jgi:serine/threonine-protein kinase
MAGPQSPIVYVFGEFQLDVDRRLLLTNKSNPVALTVKVFDTLLYLVEHRGEVVEKAALLEAVWPNVVVEENNLNQNISVLRRTLGESAGEHRFIVTVPGRGFRFVAPVSVLPESPGTAPPPATPENSPVTVASRRGWVVSAATALLLLAGAWFYFGQLKPAPATTATDATKREQLHKPRLAVLPFDNLSPDPELAFFADGLHEEILSTLARRAPGLEVISRTTMMSYRESPKSVQQLAQELSADYVIEGSVRRDAAQVRLTLQLIDARADRHLWSQNYDRTLSSVLTLQSDVAGEVATQLSVRFVGGADGVAPPTRSPEAYDLFLRAQVLRQFVTPFSPAEHFAEVEGLYDRAIAIDPSFALAITQRVGFRTAMFSYNYDTSEELANKVRDDVAAAKRLAPDDPNVLAADAISWMFIERNLPRALSSFEAAEAAGLAEPMMLGAKVQLLSRMGHADAARRLSNRILALDPANPLLIGVGGFYTAMDGHLADGLRIIERGRTLYPEHLALNVQRAIFIFFNTGRSDELRVTLDNASTKFPTLALLDQHFLLLSYERRFDELRRLLDTVQESSMRVVTGVGPGPYYGVGRRPTAQYRGWAALLSGDRVAAAREGQLVLDFVASERETPHNKWFLRLLAADGHTFLGQRERAFVAADEAVALYPAEGDTIGFSVARAAARVYAQLGAEDRAMEILERDRRLLGPAQISRDPFFDSSLAKNPRYRALVERLESQMRATRLQ